MDFIIYKITDVDTGRIYVGSTTESLKRRIQKHRNKNSLCACKDFNWGSVESEILEEGNGDKAYKLIRERYHTEQYECCNKLRAYLSKEDRKEDDRKYKEKHREYYREYKKEYNRKHKEENGEKKKEYYYENRDKIREQKREKVECECGAVVCKTVIARHRKTKKHIKLISN